MTDALLPRAASPAVTTTPARVNERERVRGLSVPVALTVILAFGLLLRLFNGNWDDGQHLHPDERFLTMVATGIEIPNSVGQYFDTARSPLNPHNKNYNSFVYGTLPLFLVRFLAVPLGATGYGEVHLLGRFVSALMDVGTVGLVYLLGARLYGRQAGLLAALLSAATVLSIQQAHFFAVDTFLVFFSTAALYFLFRALDGGALRDYALVGVAVGLAVACKLGAALFLPVIGLAVILHRLANHRRDTQRELTHDLLGATILLLAAAIAFRIAQPYAFAGPSALDFRLNPRYLQNMTEIQKLVSGEADYPPSHQWTSTTPYLFPLRNMVLWGMGPLLGLAAWIGFAWTAARAGLSWRQRHFELLLVLWVALSFLYWGGIMVKTMRYFLPIYPLLTVLAAGVLVQTARWGRRAATDGVLSSPRLATLVGWAPLVLVAVGTMLYALAFVSIYARPVTRIEASTWIYDNIPPGTPFATEHWDDAIPLRQAGRPHERYKGTQLTLYDDDNPEKLAKMETTLSQVDYIFMTSNRLYGSIPKLPMRYPLTTEYYRLLFSGELGFRLEKSVTSYPSLLGLELNDDGAEEAFTVYDHPKVLIFKKTEQYSPARVHELLSRVDLSEVIRLRPMQVPRNGLLMTESEQRAQVAGGTWSAMFDADSIANRYPIPVWLLAFEILALLAFPLAWRLLPGLADRGYALAKVLGLLFVSYGAWLLASLHVVQYGRLAIVLSAALLLGLSVAVVLRQRADFTSFVRREWRVLAVVEAVFLIGFAAFLVIRMRNPDLWHPNFGGEKPMDFAYLNAVIKSTFFPPYDPWFAGGYINYYYFGFVLVATLVKLTGIVPAVAYNLAIPLFYALTVTGAFAVGLSALRGGVRAAVLTRPALVAGVLAVVLVGVVGNLDGLVQTVEALGKAGRAPFTSRIPGLAGLLNALVGIGGVIAGRPMPGFDFWRSTRVIGPEEPGPITEFPYFSFLYGDLHAHVLALPITIAVVLIALNVVWLAEARNLLPTWSADASLRVRVRAVLWSRWLGLVMLLGLLVGTLRATNTWDFPTYLALAAVAMGIGHYREIRRIDARVVGWTIAAAGGVVSVAMLLYFPYQQHYELFYVGVDPVKNTTNLLHFLTVLALPLFAIGALLALESLLAVRSASRGLSEGTAPRLSVATLVRDPRAGVAACVVVLLAGSMVALLAGRQALAFLIALGALLVVHAVRQRRSGGALLMLALAGLALAAVAVPELVALKGDIGRMNTVFKFHLQAWVLLSLVAAPAIVLVTRRLGGLVRQGEVSPRWRTLWAVGLGVLLVGAALYPLRATPTKLGLRFEPLPPTLDGMAFMTEARYEDRNRDLRLPDDYDAIRWMLENVEGSPVILEGQSGLYRWHARFSTYTGLPTIIGWDWHQKQQRGDFAPWVDERVRDVKTLYETGDVAATRRLLRKYDVSYIVIGEVERAYYPPSGLAKFDSMVRAGQLDVAYRTGGVTIYRVVPDAVGQARP